MKTIHIYATGSCDTASRIGTAESLLEYKDRTKYLSRRLENTTANRCIIQGLIIAVEQIKEPCSVVLITATPVGAKQAARGKGVNVDLVLELLHTLNARDCTYAFEVWPGRGDEVRQRILSRRVRQVGGG